ncbi:MAG: group II intron reverse transcriptase/maturase [Pseudomonadota bacterium]
MERVVEAENVRRAWQRVKANHGAPGVDGLTVEETEAWMHNHWFAVRQSLLEGTYQPLPLRRKAIPKRSGGERLLGIPVVVDRLIQKSLQQVLTPIFDPHFSERSFGSRPARSAHGALRQVQTDARAGHRIAVDLDLEKFFDRVPHDLLMVRVARRVADPRVLSLIGRYLRAGVMVDGAVQPTPWGTPQGGPVSSLLANILLDDLDQELESRGHRFARYVDDILIVVRSRRAAERVKASITRYLTGVLQLSVNEQKSRVAKLDECVFLGFTFMGTKLRWSDEAYADFRHRLRRLTGRSWGVSMQYRLFKLREYLRGWMGYFGISDYYRPVPELDHWLRRRVRMCYWKQWRKTRTKVRMLMTLGTSRKEALMTALSRKGPWHLAKTLATQVGMTNAWLQQQGLLSIRERWLKAHGYA